MTMTRRGRASCSPELQCFIRVFGVFTRNDLEIANALVRREYDVGRASAFLGIRHDAFRQRLQTFVKKIRQVLPDYPLPAGPIAKEVSAEQHDLEWALDGVEVEADVALSE